MLKELKADFFSKSLGKNCFVFSVYKIMFSQIFRFFRTFSCELKFEK